MRSPEIKTEADLNLKKAEVKEGVAFAEFGCHRRGP